MLKVTELTGLPSDPDCLHCVLMEPLQAFSQAHPEKEPGELVCEVVQMLAELIASTAPAGCETKIALGAADFLLKEVIRAREDFQAKGLKT